MSWLKKLDAEAKDLTITTDFTPKDAAFQGGLPRTNYPYGRDVGKGLDSNVVMSPINWILRNFTESELILEALQDDVWEERRDHDLPDLLERPNEFYSGDLLWKATLVSYNLEGDAYWRKVRNQFGEVIQLWYIPHFLIEPKWPRDGSEFISHYEYRPRGQDTRQLAPRDVVHLRFGLDPRNMRTGLSPVKPLLREVFTDEEAANFSASILRNMGVPGGIIFPKDSDATPSAEDVQEMKDKMKSGFTGDQRGDWMVLGTPTDVEQFGFDPSQLLLTNLRDISEERVCAALGIPAAVVGFGAGLQQTKVGATMRELRRLAWTSAIEPMQQSMARQLNRQLLPDFQSQLRRFRLTFDSTNVPAFAEEETERTNRITQMVTSGVLRVDRAQEKLGLEVDPDQDVYLRPQGMTAVGPDGEPANMPPQLENGGPPEPEEDEDEDDEADIEDAEEVAARARMALAKATNGEG